MSKEQGSESAVSGSQFMKEEEMEEEKEAPKKLSRRQFVKGAAVGGAGVAAAGVLASCAPPATPAPGETAAPVPTCPPAGECPPAATPWLPEKWDQETDVVVVGSGFGKWAAIEAKKAGADVLIIEKEDHAGGLQFIGGDSMTMGGNNVIQQREGEADPDLEEWYQAELANTEHRCNPEVMRALVERGAETVQWNVDLGLDYILLPGALSDFSPIKRGLNLAPSPNYPGKEPLPDGALKDGGVGTHYMIQKEVERLGVPTLLNHRMMSIYREPNGPVLGVEVETPEGTINIRARKGVVLCTGSWVDNDRMLRAWDPRVVGPDCYGDGGHPAAETTWFDGSGDGHLAAAAIGAGFADMSSTSDLYMFWGSRSYFGWDPVDWSGTVCNYHPGKGLPQSEDSRQRVIFVKNDGLRYINEAKGNEERLGSRSSGPLDWPYMGVYLGLPQPRNVWQVTDADGVAALKWTGLTDAPGYDIRNPDYKVGWCLDPACIATADTLAELATKMGIDAASFEEEVGKYNGFVDAGVDADFGKPMPLYKIATPPFYGAKASIIRHAVRNGVRVNTKSQVIVQADQEASRPFVSIDEEAVIPRLYAAGELGDIAGWRRGHNLIGHYGTAARIAGENAAKETSLS